MSISDTKRGARTKLRPALIYLALTLFCVLFNVVYARFSHGVSSASMTYMFIYPLAGGTFIGLPSAFKALPLPGRFAVNAYNSGIATLTAGSCLKGIFEIAGTASPYQPAFLITGVAMISAAAASYTATLCAGKTRAKGDTL